MNLKKLNESLNEIKKALDEADLRPDDFKKMMPSFIRIGWLMDKGHLPELLDSLDANDVKKADKELVNLIFEFNEKNEAIKAVRTMETNYNAFMAFSDAAMKIQTIVEKHKWV